MSKREIATLVVRLIGVYWIIQTLPFVQYIILTVSQEVRSFAVGMAAIAGMAAVLAVGIGLLIYGDAIGRRIAAAVPTDSAPQPLTSRQIQGVAISLVGLYLLVMAIRSLGLSAVNAVHLSSAHIQPMAGPTGADMTFQWIIALVKGLLLLAMALWLFLGARRWADFWHRLQAKQEPTESSLR